MAQAKVVLLQLEIPAQISLEGAKAARQKGLRVIFDPAPATYMPEEAYEYIDFLTPNETETETLTGILPEDDQGAASAAEVLKAKGVGTVIIKMGAKGVFYDGQHGSGFVPAFKVNAIDTVAAGDAFNAGLAVALSEGKDIAEAVRWGAAAGAIATTRKGAYPAMPYREELLKLLAGQP